MNYRNTILIILIILGFTLTFGCVDSNNNSKQAVQSESVATPTEAQNTPPEYNRSLVKNYEVIKEDDISFSSSMRRTTES